MNAKRLLKSIALAVAILMGVCLIGVGAGFVLRYIPAWLTVSALLGAFLLSANCHVLSGSDEHFKGVIYEMAYRRITMIVITEDCTSRHFIMDNRLTMKCRLSCWWIRNSVQSSFWDATSAWYDDEIEVI